LHRHDDHNLHTNITVPRSAQLRRTQANLLRRIGGSSDDDGDMRQSSTPRVCCVVVRAPFLPIKPRIRRRRSALSDCSIRISCLPDTAVITIVVGGGGGAAAMSNPSGIVKRIPLIKFPNRKAGQTQGIVLRLLVLCFFPPLPYFSASVSDQSGFVVFADLKWVLSLSSLIRSCIVDA
jgi:hypothetical protein